MKNINAMEVACLRSKNATKAEYIYYIDKLSIYMDNDGDAFGDCYNEKGKWIGKVLLSRFKTIRTNLTFAIKEY